MDPSSNPSQDLTFHLAPGKNESISFLLTFCSESNREDWDLYPWWGNQSSRRGKTLNSNPGYMGLTISPHKNLLVAKPKHHLRPRVRLLYLTPSARARWYTRSIFKGNLISFPSPRPVVIPRFKSPMIFQGHATLLYYNQSSLEQWPRIQYPNAPVQDPRSFFNNLSSLLLAIQCLAYGLGLKNKWTMFIYIVKAPIFQICYCNIAINGSNSKNKAMFYPVWNLT